MAQIYTTSQNEQIEYVVKKSKFVAYCFNVQSIKDINTLLQNIKQKHTDATHICYAFELITNEQKCVDDGEPSGTAGKPILDCIKKQKLKNVLIVVVRYFGGIKLGAGGLTRAYSKSASLVLEKCKKRQLEQVVTINFNLSVKDYNKIKNLFLNQNILKHKQTYGANFVQVTAIIKTDYQQEFILQLTSLLMQQLNFNITETYYY